MSETIRRRNIDIDSLGEPIDCSNREQHTEEPPLGYVGWHMWAARMGKTHRQVKCEGCGLFRIWEKRKRDQR